jgi:Domain of unknown function DUF11/Beta-propeller repeat
MNSSRSLAHSLRVTTATFFNPSHHKYFLLALLLLCPIAAAAQGTPPAWIQAFGSEGNGANIANAIKAAPDHSLYAAGQFSSTATFGGTTLTSAGGLDIFLAKYSPSGSLLWIAQASQEAGGNTNDAGNGVDLDKDGNVYLTGSLYGSGTFYSANSNGTKITVANGGEENAIFLAKYTSSGTLLWVQTGTSDCGPVCPILGYGVAVNPAAGTVYVSGVTQSTTTFSSADGTNHVISGNGAWTMFLAKYDANGNFEWAELNSAAGNTVGHTVAVDAQDNAYTVGWMEGTTTFFSADGHNITIGGFGIRDIYLAKYDTNGNAQWANHIGGGFQAIPAAVTTGPSGEIALSGFIGNGSQTIVSSQSPGANINLGSGTNPSNVDGVIATYNSGGVATLATRRDGSGNESANGLAYDSRGNLYVAAVDQGNGKPQLFVDEYSGKHRLWEATADAGTWLPDPGITPALTIDSAGSVFVAGGYPGTASFGNIKLSGTGATEVFVAELNTASENHPADLYLRAEAAPTPYINGQLLTYTFRVWNLGPGNADQEVLTTQVPYPFTFDYIRISGTPGLGTCTTPPYGETGAIVCYENSSMAPNTTWTVRLTVQLLPEIEIIPGDAITESATVTADTLDPNPANNTVTVITTVQ